ncbi:hypothetical protein BJ138DRAFT_1129315 [Hygrophoropsis aurantiaca]|uniref:Uncharacterized protein n=1 Tax=Hygrophoropsis aurantiaca TaxID=72124 RepID=A0ACB8A3C2_9AGAM|nr:hypothetical protein BJ138DRAFT_1129315 [Hygrophoropsis aurantiaca]
MADPVLILQMQQTMNYVTAAAATFVLYDQILTSSQEVDLVWNRQWSFMTALYLIARYFGSLYVIGNAAMYVYINWTYSVIVNILLVINWTENIFILTMQAMLVIRVYALFNQSKKVLIFLATCYVLQAVAVFVITGLMSNKQVLEKDYTSVGPAIGSVEQAITANLSAVSNTMDQDSTILSIAFDSILLLFALWAFVKHALEAKTVNGGWSINVLVRTLVADHVLYFICNLIWLSLSIAANSVEFSVSSAILLGNTLDVFGALVVVAGPRMVISIRTTENKTRGKSTATLEGEVSTVQFGVREQPTHSESVMEEGSGLRATDGNV